MRSHNEIVTIYHQIWDYIKKLSEDLKKISSKSKIFPKIFWWENGFISFKIAWESVSGFQIVLDIAIWSKITTRTIKIAIWNFWIAVGIYRVAIFIGLVIRSKKSRTLVSNIKIQVKSLILVTQNQTCSESQKVKSSQNHDFDFLFLPN